MATSPLTGLPVPDPDAAHNVPGDMLALAAAIDPMLNMKFVNSAQRDAVISAPVEGMECFVGTGAGAKKQIYFNGKWVSVFEKPLFQKFEKVAPADAYTGTVRCWRDGDDVTISWFCQTSLAVGALLDILAVGELPEVFRPINHTEAPAMHGTGGYPLTGAILTTGRVYARNNHTAAVPSHQGTATYKVRADPA